MAGTVQLCHPTFGYGDILDIFAISIVGTLLASVFPQAIVAAFNGYTSIPRGWLDHHYKQLGVQLANSTGFGWSFVLTVSRLRATELGISDEEMG